MKLPSQGPVYQRDKMNLLDAMHLLANGGCVSQWLASFSSLIYRDVAIEVEWLQWVIASRCNRGQYEQKIIMVVWLTSRTFDKLLCSLNERCVWSIKENRWTTTTTTTQRKKKHTHTKRFRWRRVACQLCCKPEFTCVFNNEAPTGN